MNGVPGPGAARPVPDVVLEKSVVENVEGLFVACLATMDSA
jgi:hypothetical protein